MNAEVSLMCLAVVIGIVVLLSSKFVRTVCREAITHPRQHCEINVHGNKRISVKRTEQGTGGLKP
jgi:hypothetical protein